MFDGIHAFGDPDNVPTRRNVRVVILEPGLKEIDIDGLPGTFLVTKDAFGKGGILFVQRGQRARGAMPKMMVEL